LLRSKAVSWNRFHRPASWKARIAPGGQASGHQQNKQAGPFEEHAKVKADTAPVDQEAQHDSGGQTQQRPQRRPDADILLEGRQQKEDRLQPLTGDREKDHHHQRPAVVITALQRLIHGLLQLLL
jgi:hypothetical protein